MFRHTHSIDRRSLRVFLIGFGAVTAVLVFTTLLASISYGQTPPSSLTVKPVPGTVKTLPGTLRPAPAPLPPSVASLQPLANGSVEVSISIIDEVSCKRIMGRASDSVSVWEVAVQNLSNQTVTISEPAVLRRIPQLGPKDQLAMTMLVNRAVQISWPRRIASGVDDLAKIGVFVSAAKDVNLSQSHMLALTGFIAFAPMIGNRFTSRAIPVKENFELLAWREPMVLSPGDSATAKIFTQKWKDDAKPVLISIPVRTLPTARVAQ